MTNSSYSAIDQIVGESAWNRCVHKRIVQVAGYQYSVLITGPTGTGKEMVARAIHAQSSRVEQPFVPVNCASVPGGLFASQLFGHLKGSFTGASYTALGCFRAAEGGTIFLDEIGDLDLDLQAKLLRVLQEKCVVPVGSHESITVDVRVIAATNRDLEKECREGRFRWDLYYRLNVVSIKTAALKDRKGDIEPLVNHFLAKAAIENGLGLKELSPAALAMFHAYPWPGNVRELQNLIEQAIVFTEGDVLGPEAFGQLAKYDVRGTKPDDPRQVVKPALFDPANLEEDDLVDSFEPQRPDTQSWPTLAEVERAHILRTLEMTFYNRSAAARMLHIDRKVLARKIKKYNLIDHFVTLEPS